MPSIRNIAIIAHVDHGKTTLVDALLRQAHTKLSKDAAASDLIMDSNDIERERGITIFSKNASVMWQDVKINIIDTPGHADFGGEVERVLSMADGCLLLVDAKEGPMPQTRFVLKKALSLKHKIIVVINKIDKSDANPDHALDKTFDLFVELGADDRALDFPIVYASAKQGKAGLEADITTMNDITPLFDVILKHIPAPTGNAQESLQMLITSLSSDDFKGKIGIGRIYNGTMRKGQEIVHINRVGVHAVARITSLMTFIGLERVEVESAEAGDIVALAGISDITIGETIADKENPKALPLLSVDQPTVKMVFTVNNSPFAGTEGTYSTSRQVRERLAQELQTDVALRIEDSDDGAWTVSGRGELHLAIFIERLRREGYEFQVGRPHVIAKEVDGKTMVPYEWLTIEVPEEYSGLVIENIGKRNGVMQDMKVENGVAFMEFLIPTRGLFGYRNEFLTETRGLGIMHSIFYQYQPDVANWREREQGSLVATEAGVTNLYGLLNIQNRGILFLGSAVKIYKGQVVGQHSRSGDLQVNACKAKELSNMRSKGDGPTEHFDVPRVMLLENALQYIGDDEMVEVTPLNVRIRKIVLDKDDERRRARGMTK
ncbi:MAG: GTP-binding protein TypA [Candidatus Jacksonbacteria bacterium RIFCSPLOWO2_02_FULL_43_9]|nr:MAG: GTP-binding protein TypA [Parcubacteria group bacterium GW2011_GWA2_43_13]OGY68740.1 MAG: GTP-binding protein TypA [Candidatus Jacksonbacteria bacterium RIFCSPHIGHO2_02_FULL_43_10]OGY71059.1 MAG: GTP-binding protein TypA [Candidatus Jacksonbacteria bacterium RIFCSPLOWO2_01_FULL_44_13]OGY73847.1 MAG: GTP-binding protein TypA [Candidatus Jacksonbacteria bacterium RIFCSPLOWO2_02_FULL_43_9]